MIKEIVMKKILILGATLFVILGLLNVNVANASHSVTRCTNSCVVTYENGKYYIEDCCGGRVETVWPRHETKEK